MGVTFGEALVPEKTSAHIDQFGPKRCKFGRMPFLTVDLLIKQTQNWMTRIILNRIFLLQT